MGRARVLKQDRFPCPSHLATSRRGTDRLETDPTINSLESLVAHAQTDGQAEEAEVAIDRAAAERFCFDGPRRTAGGPPLLPHQADLAEGAGRSVRAANLQAQLQLADRHDRVAALGRAVDERRGSVQKRVGGQTKGSNKRGRNSCVLFFSLFFSPLSRAEISSEV